MNAYQLDYFLKEIAKDKGSQAEVIKSDIYDFCISYELPVKENTARESMIELIQQRGLSHNLYEAFSCAFSVPIWEAASYYGLYSSELTALLEAGGLDIPTEEKEYKGKQSSFKALTIPLNSLSCYTSEQVKQLYDACFKQREFKYCIGTGSIDEVVYQVNKLRQIIKWYNNLNERYKALQAENKRLEKEILFLQRKLED